MFKPVSPKLDVTALEEGVLQFWKDRKIFEKTGSQRKGAPEYVFFEARPPLTANPASTTWRRVPSRTCSRATRS